MANVIQLRAIEKNLNSKDIESNPEKAVRCLFEARKAKKQVSDLEKKALLLVGPIPSGQYGNIQLEKKVIEAKTPSMDWKILKTVLTDAQMKKLFEKGGLYFREPSNRIETKEI